MRTLEGFCCSDRAGGCGAHPGDRYGHISPQKTRLVITGEAAAHPQAVHTLEGVSALFGLPLPLPPAPPARGVGGVGGCVRALHVGPTLDTDRVILPMGSQY